MEDLQKAITSRNFEKIRKYFFDNEDELNKKVKLETGLWDYKENIPDHRRDSLMAWSKIAKHVLAFHNAKGGVIIFGVSDSFEVKKTKAKIDSKKFNDKMKKYIPDSIHVDFFVFARDSSERYIGIAIIPPRGSVIKAFTSNSPKDKDGQFNFKKGWSAIRNEDQSMLLNIKEFEDFKKRTIHEKSNLFDIDEPMYKLLTPDYKTFVKRKYYCELILKGINDARTSIVSITGIGGIGKTALATWAVRESYKNKKFNFIISVTAKDRELAQHGINAIFPTLTTFESLLSSILDVLGFSDFKSNSLHEQEKFVQSILEKSNGLLYIDNLETIEDDNVIKFLDDLPYGVKAITTSRRHRVKFSVFPITIEKMDKSECVEYLESLSKEDGLIYLKTLKRNESELIGRNVDGIPLAIKWCAKRSSSISEFLSLSQEIKDSGRASEELLEFSYRRIFDKMKNSEKYVLYVLACFNREVETSVIVFVANIYSDIEDSIDSLADDSLILKKFNEIEKHYEYSLMPLTKNFIMTEMNVAKSEELNIRNRIRTYYDATDIQDNENREIIKKIRNIGDNKCHAYISVSDICMTKKDYNGAKESLLSAIKSDEKNYLPKYKLAMLFRHHIKETANSLKYFNETAILIKKTDPEYSVFYREFGLLYLFIRDKDSKERAKECFEKSLTKCYDSISVGKLSQLLFDSGKFRLAIDLIKSYLKHMNDEDKKHILPILRDSYAKSNDSLKSFEVNKEIENIKK